MKIEIIVGTTVALSFSLMSHSDFLAEDPRGKLAPENFLSTQDELNMSIYTLYQKVNLSQVYTNMQLPQWQGNGIMTNPGSNKQPATEIDKFAAVGSNRGVKGAQNMHYVIVEAANLIIQGVFKTSTTQDEINIAPGQVKFWKVYAYSALVRLWRPLPMNLGNINDDYTKSLSSVKEAYGHIVQNLTEVEAVPSMGYSGGPRFLNGVNAYVTRQVAKSTLAVVYMVMAGWLMNRTKYYAKAAGKAKGAIEGVNRGRYEHKLGRGYKDAYAMNNNYNNETVFGISYSPFVNWAQDSELTSCNQFGLLGGWGDVWGEIHFWKELPDDSRKDTTYDPKIRLKDGMLANWWGLKGDGTPAVPEYHPMLSIFSVNWDPASKVDTSAPYDYTKPANQNMRNDHRYRIIRYSEILLWYAEAKAGTGQTDELAFKCLNGVRERAGLEPFTGLSAGDLAEAAYKERGWEMAGYWMVLVTRRTDRLRMNRLKGTFKERAENMAVEVADRIPVKESVEYTDRIWSDNLMYLPYLDMDFRKNPNLVG